MNKILPSFSKQATIRETVHRVDIHPQSIALLKSQHEKL